MASQIKIPTLGEADGTYAALEKKLVELNADAAETARGISELQDDIVARPPPRVSYAVAELLGETIAQELLARGERLRELRRHSEAVEVAIGEVQKRIRERQSAASAAACTSVRAEYGRRVRALVDALETVHAARSHAEDLLDAMEREGIQIERLPAVRPHFLGDLQDGHISRFIREAREAGYVD
ncbi:hypothetical protein [Oryzifoliimicrobium ureilyticus]|uniref:hypothetical protein n=1 Tax=Oryzifoliimicrobium ureilyticus TaxID=3113724 RepID=UPI003075FDDF